LQGVFFVIVGRVDEMTNGKVYGWAFNSDSPDEHLEVRVHRGVEVIASGQANLMRIDLPGTGVGKGDHAFEIVLPANITSFHGIMIVAKSASAGEAPLTIAANDERRVDDLFQVFAQRYDEVLIALRAEIDRLNGAGGLKRDPELDAIPEFDRRLSDLEKRIEELEVFILRLEEISSVLQERAGLTRKRGFFSFLFRRNSRCRP
jgi:hypothetical protein